MTEGLKGCIARLERSQQHLDALGLSVKAFRERETYDITLSRNVQRNSKLRLIAIYKELEPVPVEWSLLVSDAIHNLRSALENAVWALSVRNVGEAGVLRPGDVHFPIHRHERDFDVAARRALVHLSDEERALVKRLQPFNAEPDEPDPHPLLLLHDLNRVDKHRELSVVLHSLAAYHIQLTPRPPDAVIHQSSTVRLEHGAVLASVEFTRPPRDVDVDVEHTIAYEISLGETRYTPQLPLGEAVTAMHQWAVNAIAWLDPRSH